MELREFDFIGLQEFDELEHAVPFKGLISIELLDGTA